MAKKYSASWAAICSRNSSVEKSVNVGDIVGGRVARLCQLGALIDVNLSSHNGESENRSASAATLVALLPNCHGGDILEEGDEVDGLRISSIDAATGRAILETSVCSIADATTVAKSSPISNVALASLSEVSFERLAPSVSSSLSIDNDAFEHGIGRNGAADKCGGGPVGGGRNSRCHTNKESCSSKVTVELCNGRIPVLLGTDNATADHEAWITASHADGHLVEEALRNSDDATSIHMNCWMLSTLDECRIAFLHRWSSAAGFGKVDSALVVSDVHPADCSESTVVPAIDVVEHTKIASDTSCLGQCEAGDSDGGNSSDGFWEIGPLDNRHTNLCSSTKESLRTLSRSASTRVTDPSSLAPVRVAPSASVAQEKKSDSGDEDTSDEDLINSICVEAKRLVAEEEAPLENTLHHTTRRVVNDQRVRVLDQGVKHNTQLDVRAQSAGARGLEKNTEQALCDSDNDDALVDEIFAEAQRQVESSSRTVCTSGVSVVLAPKSSVRKTRWRTVKE